MSIPVEEGVYKADHIYTAFVLGFFKPAVYLPHYISEEQYRYVLTHEKVHIQRKDYLFKLIASLVRYFYWWNPFVWIACYFMEKDMEMSCDEAVIKVLGEEEKGAYAKATLVGEPEALEGTIRSSVEEGTVPEFNGESNFGGIGDAYTYTGRDDQIGVLMGDGEYHVFYKLD
ncbi:MAG: M56 family metallopeptidase [Lachnospiraceae bacterium]|nr:M56 family metallopeptidase [Lachnospiraceae bacterium]